MVVWPGVIGSRDGMESFFLLGGETWTKGEGRMGADSDGVIEFADK